MPEDGPRQGPVQAERSGQEKVQDTSGQAVDPGSKGRWFLKGMAGLASLPALILCISFVGFTAFAQQSGIPVDQAVFMTGIVWALPAKLILVNSISTGASLLTAFLAVTLSSIRMMPMVAALVPELKGPRTRTLPLLLVSHLVAVTAWVMAMERVPHVPRERRVIYFAGLGVALTGSCMLIVGLLYDSVAEFPPLVAGSLFFLTPVYFLASIWSSGKQRVIHVALVTGLLLGPLCTLLAPEFDLLIAGIGGGTLAWALDYAYRRHRGSVSETEAAVAGEEGP